MNSKLKKLAKELSEYGHYREASEVYALIKEADTLDRIISNASPSDSLPLRDNPVTGAKRQHRGCRPTDESSYCKKMRHFLKTFNRAVVGKSFYKEHLLKHGLTESYVDDWGHEIWAKKASDPYNLEGYGEETTEEDLHKALISIAKKASLGYIPDYELKQRQVRDKRRKNSDYGDFIESLWSSITNPTLGESASEIRREKQIEDAGKALDTVIQSLPFGAGGTND